MTDPNPKETTCDEDYTVARLRRDLEGVPDHLRVITHGEFLDAPWRAGVRWIKPREEGLGEGEVVKEQDGAEKVFYIGWE